MSETGQQERKPQECPCNCHHPFLAPQQGEACDHCKPPSEEAAEPPPETVEDLAPMIDEQARWQSRVDELEAELVEQSRLLAEVRAERDQFKAAWEAAANVAKKAVSDMGAERVQRKGAEAEVARLSAERDDLDRQRVQSAAMVDAICAAADGEPVSDFMASFSPVRAVVDLHAEVERLNGLSAGSASLREALDSLGLTSDATIASVQRRLRVGAANAMRLLSLREACAALSSPATPEGTK